MAIVITLTITMPYLTTATSSLLQLTRTNITRSDLEKMFFWQKDRLFMHSVIQGIDAEVSLYAALYSNCPPRTPSYSARPCHY